jgi:hypothetical protein
VASPEVRAPEVPPFPKTAQSQMTARSRRAKPQRGDGAEGTIMPSKVNGKRCNTRQEIISALKTDLRTDALNAMQDDEMIREKTINVRFPRAQRAPFLYYTFALGEVHWRKAWRTLGSLGLGCQARPIG